MCGSRSKKASSSLASFMLVDIQLSTPGAHNEQRGVAQQIYGCTAQQGLKNERPRMGEFNFGAQRGAR